MNTATRVLVIEDDPIIAMDIVQTLRTFNYDAAGPYAAGEDALRELSTIRPAVVLMDINLSGKIDGIATAKTIRDSHQLPVIFLTADTDEKTLQRAMLADPYGYLIKPFDPIELRSTIETILHRHVMTQGLTDGRETRQADRQAAQAEQIAGILPEGVQEDDKIAILKNVPLFRDVPLAALKALADDSTLHQLDGGQVIITPEQEASGGFIPVSGRVSVTKTSETGKELVVALLAPGDVFGLFYTLESFRGSSWARTQIPSRIIWVSGAGLQAMFRSVPAVLSAFTEELARRLVHCHEFATSLAHSRVEERITTMLLTLLKEFGKSTGKPNEGRIFITRRELADLVGTTPETAVRVTKNLEREGLLELSRPGIIKILNINTLRDFAQT